ncbi:unnamed protein product [Rangifer tarandus platyrhynchus]|uniref:Uncharacterized protein n=1 Tax=Rangifer tarandus platyrhynchus TaxID=3082113 RepID=A0AC59Z605_RANTA
MPARKAKRGLTQPTTVERPRPERQLLPDPPRTPQQPGPRVDRRAELEPRPSVSGDAAFHVRSLISRDQTPQQDGRGIRPLLGHFWGQEPTTPKALCSNYNKQELNRPAASRGRSAAWDPDKVTVSASRPRPSSHRSPGLAFVTRRGPWRICPAPTGPPGSHCASRE